LFTYLYNRSDYYVLQLNKWKKDQNKPISQKLLEIDYDSLLQLIPDELSLSSPIQRKRAHSLTKHMNCVSGTQSSDSDKGSQKFSNLSEMYKVLSKSMSMLEGIPVPTLR